MVDEKAAPDGCARMDFDAGQKPSPLGQQPREKRDPCTPQRMRNPMIDNRMQSRVQQYLSEAGRRGIVAKDSCDIRTHKPGEPTHQASFAVDVVDGAGAAGAAAGAGVAGVGAAAGASAAGVGVTGVAAGTSDATSVPLWAR
jgi:hypothetical protein